MFRPILVATEAGTVNAYNPTVNSSTAIIVIDQSGVSANYKGLAKSRHNLYVADFFNNRIDVFNTSFVLQTGFSFIDPQLPAGYAPFNIIRKKKQLYVLYAKQNSTKSDAFTGPGNGYISVFNLNGGFYTYLLVKVI